MSLYNKHRPKRFKDIYGHKDVVESLPEIIKSANSFILHGPSGTGKTSVSRLCAGLVGCESLDLFEIDAASNSGIDAMKKIADYQRSLPMFGKSKVFIIDECHRLSKQAWDSLLKDIEEPPEYSYWFFCTTDVKSIPKTVRTRCTEFELKSLSGDNMFNLIQDISRKENYDIPAEINKEIVLHSDGSPRQALNHLEYVLSLSDITLDKIKEHFSTKEEESTGGYQIAKMISKENWTLSSVLNEVKKLKTSKTELPETTRIVILNYFNTIILSGNANSYTLSALNIFSQPVIEQNGFADITLRIAKLAAKRVAVKRG